MNGPEYAVERLRVALAARLPDGVEELNERLGLAGESRLQAVTAVYGYEPGELSVNEWPWVHIVATGLDRVTVAEGGDYLCRYGVQVWAWARGMSHEDTDLQRKRLILAVREALLGAPELDVAPPGVGEGALGYAGVDLTSYAERYSDVVLDAGDRRSVAAAIATLAVEVEESLPRTGLGQVATIDLDVIPLHPNVAEIAAELEAFQG